jgi:aminopeptidase
MPGDFASRLRAFAEVIVRVGLNLQRGQRLLIAEPYELQGVARSAEVIVEAVRTMALEAGCTPGSEASAKEPHPASVEVIWGDAAQLRRFAEKADWRGFARLVGQNSRKMEQYMRNGDALLFLQGSQPRLMEGIPPGSVTELRRIGWEHFGPVAQQLVAGATNWTVVPAPSPDWADVVYADRPGEQRLSALWEDVFGAMRISRWGAASGRAQQNPPGGLVPPQTSALAAWQSHLQCLQKRRDELNARRVKTLRYLDEGTDLTVTLPPEHTWCTAQLKTKSGVPFVANLPTEEVFTLPHKDSAEGVVRVSRPVNYGGTVIEEIELELKEGRVVHARARIGSNVLARLLDTDEGAARLGEVAIVGLPLDGSRFDRAASASSPWQNSDRLFYHPLLEENASNHIALGEGYAFCLRSPNPTALNRSLIHVDLPLNASAVLPG